MTVCQLPAVHVRTAIDAAIECYDQALAADKYAKVAGRRERLVMLLDLVDASMLHEREGQFVAMTADDFALCAEHYGKAATVRPEHDVAEKTAPAE